MIEPSVGRIVHYFLANVHDKPHAALLVGVNSERNINLAVFNDDGSHFRAVSVPLLQDQDTPPENAPYAAWMVYQKGQAAKTEALQATTAAPPAPAPAVDLSPLHTKLSELEQGVEGKFHDLGNWLQKTVGDFHSRLSSLEKPPAAPVPPAPGSEAQPKQDLQAAQQGPAS